MPNGQANQGPETIDDVAQFLVDNPEADVEEDEQISEESPEDNSEEQEDAPAEDESEEEESEEPKEQTSGLKFKVPVKGEDGSDTTIEVDEKELIAGYQRHADYTRKTQQLADKEREVTQVVAQKLEEGRSHYLQQAQLARTAILQIAGLKSPQELEMLAQTDPASWAHEKQRADNIHAYLAWLDQNAAQEVQKSQLQREQEAARLSSQAWGILGQEGFNREKLAKLYQDVSSKYSKYGVTFELAAQTMHPGLVMLMRDAMEYQGLKEKKPGVVKKAQEAPKLPAQRQSVPKGEQQKQQLSRRFTSGKAKLNDLAGWIASNNL